MPNFSFSISSSTINTLNDLKIPSIPKVSYYNNCTEYRNEKGILHREDGPARIWNNGTEHWYSNGSLHRVGGPSITADNKQTFIYHKKGYRHRLNAPAYINKMLDYKEWWLWGYQQSDNVRF